MRPKHYPWTVAIYVHDSITPVSRRYVQRGIAEMAARNLRKYTSMKVEVIWDGDS